MAAPADAKRSDASPTKTLGQGGTSLVSGYVVNKEQAASLQGSARFTTFSKAIANTAIVATGLRYYLNILGKATWGVEAAKDKDGNELPGSKEIAEAVENMLDDMSTPWKRVIRRGAMFRFLGFSVQEWTAKMRDDGLVGMLDVESRPQVTITRWDTDPSGTVLGCIQQPPSGGDIYLPRGKIVHLVDDALEDSPEGLGLLRHVIASVNRLNGYEDLEEVGFETDLRGIPVVKAPLKKLQTAVDAGTITKAQADSVLAPLMSFIKGHLRSSKSGMMIDSAVYESKTADGGAPSAAPQFSAELLNGSSNSQEAIDKAITRTTWEIARILSVEHLLLGSDGAGSLALGKVKTNDFYMVVSSTLDELREGYQRDFITPICLLNGWDKALWPKLTTDSVQFKDVEAMATALKDMATAGAPLAPDDPAINEMRDLMGLSRVPQETIDRALDEADAMLQAKVNPPPRPAAPGTPSQGQGPQPDKPVKPEEKGAQGAKQ